MVLDGNPFMNLERGEAIPSVDPGDLRKLWEYFQSRPNGNAAVGMDLMKQVCSPGADVYAVWSRISMLALLDKAMGSLGRWLHDGKLDDAAVAVAATFPMKWMQAGKVYDALPFDVERFLKEVEKLSEK